MRPISNCSGVSGCGLRVGYAKPGGGEICWLHAEQIKLPAHVEWAREFKDFMKDFATKFRRTSTARDNYGVLGH
jgi:hypothetical protein